MGTKGGVRLDVEMEMSMQLVHFLERDFKPWEPKSQLTDMERHRQAGFKPIGGGSVSHTPAVVSGCFQRETHLHA